MGEYGRAARDRLNGMSDLKRTEGANRRDFLTGKILQREAARVGDAIADELAAVGADRKEPSAGDTVRLTTRAMACEFSVIMNPGPAEQISVASDGLDLVHRLEDQMSVYRENSELSRVNRLAARNWVEVEATLYRLLSQSAEICRRTEGSFDPTSGPLIALWRQCREDDRIPTDTEVAAALRRTGIDHVEFDDSQVRVRFTGPDTELNLGGIGKGHALDRTGTFLTENGVSEWLTHGGHSSLLARGGHNGLAGWPIGLRNPLFPTERLATVLLKDCALSTSGIAVQGFRHAGKRYGHILNPRTGWPVEGMLSVTVFAPTAAEADALSTAFFVMGVENSRDYCDNCPDVSALLIPPPSRGRQLEIINCGLSEDLLFFAPSG